MMTTNYVDVDALNTQHSVNDSFQYCCEHNSQCKSTIIQLTRKYGIL